MQPSQTRGDCVLELVIGHFSIFSVASMPFHTVMACLGFTKASSSGVWPEELHHPPSQPFPYFSWASSLR